MNRRWHNLGRRAWSPRARGPAAWLSLAAAPLGWAYAQLTRLNAWAHASGRRRQTLADRPVISIGNLTAGGTGKTPLTEFVCNYLISKGYSPAVVTRGYGGRVGPGPHLVQPDDPPDLVGDEPLLLAARPGVMVVAGSNRPAGAELAVNQGADVIVLDDGFQHLPLARSLNIVLLDAAHPLANGRCHPAGALREPPSALDRADLIILTRAETKPNPKQFELVKRHFHGPILTARHRVTGVVDPAGQSVDLTGRKALVAAGVARPGDVVRSVRGLGPARAILLPLADHQTYGPAEIEAINRRYQETGADCLVVTAKDWVKLEPMADQLATPPLVTRLTMEIDPEPELTDRLDQAAQGRGPVAGVLKRSPRPLPDQGRLIVRLPNWIGDAVMAQPVLANLRAGLPGWSITALATPWVAGLLAAEPAMDDLVVYRPNGDHAGLRGRYRLAGQLRGRFDLGLLLPNSFDSALIFKLAGLPRRIGYARDGRSPLLTDRVPVTAPLKACHHLEYYLGLLTYLGLPAPGHQPAITVSRTASDWADDFLAGLDPTGSDFRLGLAPGAAFGPAKRWPADRFAQAAGRLLKSRGGRAFIFGGADDFGPGQEIAEAVGPAAVNLAGETGLDQAVALLARMDAVITNDSGLMHLAAALNRPVVALFGPTDHRRTGPRGERCRLIVAQADCAPCLKPVCPLGRPCLETITAEQVVEAVEELLG